MENKFSIICPIFNAEKYLEEAIVSVLKQEYENWELILIDDKSTDNSAVICEKYKSNKIKFLKNDSNKGQYFSRIKGIIESTGNKVLFLDADDTLNTKTLSTLNNIILDKNYDLISFNFSTFSNENVSLRNDQIIDDYKILTNTGQIIYNYFFKYFLLSLCTTCFDKKIFKRIDLKIDEMKFGEDALFLSEIINLANNAYLIKDSLYNYRMVSNSVTHTASSLLSYSRIINLNKIYSNFSMKFTLSKKYFYRFTWAMINYIIDCAKEFDFCNFKAKIKLIKKLYIYQYFSVFGLKSRKNSFLVFLIKINFYRLCYNFIRTIK